MNKDKYLTTAPQNIQITVHNGEQFPNLEHKSGDSVDKHKNLEEANMIVTGDEIHQQNENL